MSDFCERFAACWRDIGQPSTDRLAVLVSGDSDEFDKIESTVLGMPVFEINGTINGIGIAIANPFDGDCEAVSAFEEAWKASS